MDYLVMLKRVQSLAIYRLRRRYALWVSCFALLLLAVSAYALTNAHAMVGSQPVVSANIHAAQPASALPADRFMQSVITRDGTLGWRQLCPPIQAQVSQQDLARQAGAEQAADARQGLALSLDYVGARPRPRGGELRVYVVMARWPSGAARQRTYSVLTAASGCVEDVKSA